MSKPIKLLIPIFLFLAVYHTPTLSYAATPTLLPSSPLYFLKTLYEGVRVFFVFDPVGKAEVFLEQADTRLNEAVASIKEGNTDVAARLVLATSNYTDKAWKSVENQPLTLKKRLEETISQHTQTLNSLNENKDETLRGALLKVEDKNQQLLEEVASKIDNFSLNTPEKEEIKTKKPSFFKNLFGRKFISPVVEE